MPCPVQVGVPLPRPAQLGVDVAGQEVQREARDAHRHEPREAGPRALVRVRARAQAVRLKPQSGERQGAGPGDPRRHQEYHLRRCPPAGIYTSPPG